MSCAKCFFIFLHFALLSGFANKPYVVLSANKSFASQCINENTIYEIKYDYNLNGATVRIPKGCVLRLNGGSINNGRLFLMSDVKIIGSGERLNRLIIGIENKNVNNVLIEGIELFGYKNGAKEKSQIITGICVYPGGSVNNITISNCQIHDFNAGIYISGTNVNIKDNILYNNGHKETITGIHDSELDICAGYSSTNVYTCNFSITGNRCLSKYVHRNIDCGELLSEDNILISNNFCVCMDGKDKESAKDHRKAQCILVGYTGVSEKDKGVIISNNICKDCSWGAIYVRANNTSETVGRNGYVAMITGNYIENVRKTEGSMFGAGIACAVREGSIISNNIIKNCTQGINIGHIYNHGYVKVFGNMIDNCDFGIINESVAKKVDITDNSITNVHDQGIFIIEATSASSYSPDKFVNIADNTIILNARNEKKNSNSLVGILAYNIGTYSCRISSNYIHDNNDRTSVGIVFRCNAKTSNITIRDNYLSGCRIGVSQTEVAKSSKNGYSLQNNTFVNCQQEMAGIK